MMADDNEEDGRPAEVTPKRETPTVTMGDVALLIARDRWFAEAMSVIGPAAESSQWIEQVRALDRVETWLALVASEGPEAALAAQYRVQFSERNAAILRRFKNVKAGVEPNITELPSAHAERRSKQVH